MKKPKSHWEPSALANLQATLDSREAGRRLTQRITPASPLAWPNQIQSLWVAPRNERRK